MGRNPTIFTFIEFSSLKFEPLIQPCGSCPCMLFSFFHKIEKKNRTTFLLVWHVWSLKLSLIETLVHFKRGTMLQDCKIHVFHMFIWKRNSHWVHKIRHVLVEWVFQGAYALICWHCRVLGLCGCITSLGSWIQLAMYGETKHGTLEICPRTTGNILYKFPQQPLYVILFCFKS